MISRKVCIVGAFCVGKTALVQRYVYSLFSDRYLSTLGVKISKKIVELEDENVNMIIWDLEGKDDYSGVNFSYLRGAMGVFIVADGTRLETLDTAVSLRASSLELVGDIPTVLLLNKADLAGEWEVKQDHIEEIEKQGIIVMQTSAKTGQGVEGAFTLLAQAMR